MFTSPCPRLPHQSAVLASTAGALQGDAEAHSRTPHLQGPPKCGARDCTGATDWSLQTYMPHTPKSGHLTILWGAKEEMGGCQLLDLRYPKRNSPVQTVGWSVVLAPNSAIMGCKDPAGWHPGTQPGWHTLFSCVSGHVSAQRVGQTVTNIR